MVSQQSGHAWPAARGWSGGLALAATCPALRPRGPSSRVTPQARLPSALWCTGQVGRSKAALLSLPPSAASLALNMARDLSTKDCASREMLWFYFIVFRETTNVLFTQKCSHLKKEKEYN